MLDQHQCESDVIGSDIIVVQETNEGTYLCNCFFLHSFRYLEYPEGYTDILQWKETLANCFEGKAKEHIICVKRRLYCKTCQVSDKLNFSNDE